MLLEVHDRNVPLVGRASNSWCEPTSISKIQGLLAGAPSMNRSPSAAGFDVTVTWTVLVAGGWKYALTASPSPGFGKDGVV